MANENQDGGDGGGAPPANIVQTVCAPSATPMVEFDPTKEVWLLYKERLENYFLVCSIENPDRKKAFLINCIGPKPYKLVRDLCTPDTPASKTYAELCVILDLHYTPPIIAYKERRRFYSAQKSGDESAGEWLVRLKFAASACDFGNLIENVLLDKFIMGLDGRPFDRLCEEDHKTLTLAKALELASKWEVQSSSTKNVNAVKSSGSTHGGAKFSHQHNHNQPSSSKQGRTGNADQPRCKHCGYKNHKSEHCKFRKSTCHRCQKEGHLATICKQPKSVNQVSEEGKIDEFCNHIYGINSQITDNSMHIQVNIDNTPHTFLLDSGASVSALPFHIFKSKFTQHTLQNCMLKLNAYSGHDIQVMGEFTPTLTFNKKTQKVKLLVVNTTGPSILGRDFMSTFKISFTEINSLEHNLTLDQLLSKCSKLFEPTLGKFEYSKVGLEVVESENVRPVFFKPRQVPYAFRSKVEDELDRLEQLGVISPVETSAWGTPLVPVLKPDGGIRICADYKVTINKHLADHKHPLPRVEDIFNALQGGCSFTKLDLVSAYNQLELDEPSRKLAAWSTHRGVYLVNRLPFGVKPATAIFQRELEKILIGIPGVVNFLDDIVVTGTSESDHIANLHTVFSRLLDAGFRLNRNKCEFFQKEIKFLGHRINKDGLSKTNERVAAIVNTPPPKNVSEVRAFAGLINYYGRFLQNLAQKMSPIYRLLQKNVDFVWDKKCQERFTELKEDIVQKVVLSHFNPKMPIILTCDASSYGIGAVLSHILPSGEEKPIAFCSRTLTSAEKNYSVIDREALAIIFACKKFYQYLIGHHFTLKTDHKPLIHLFGENSGIPAMAASRIQRWASFLSAFDYSIEYAKGCENNADAFSRLPLVVSDQECLPEKNYLNFILDNTNFVDHKSVKAETAKDLELSKLYSAIQTGNFTGLDKTTFKPFLIRSSELSIEFGIIMWGYRVVIPRKLRPKLLQTVHASHFGIVKTKSLARSFMWWPGIDSDLENMIKSCNACLSVRPDPPKAPLITWEATDRVWSRIHIDFAGPINKNYFLIITDSHSKWPEVFKTKQITTSFTISKLREIFARFGLPETIVSDNGTQFTSSLFQKFVKLNKIKHITSAPGHPATNGAAENSVKSFKNGLKSALTDGKTTDIDIIMQRYLFDYRITEHCSTRESPAKIMFARKLRSRFTFVNPPTVKENISISSEKQRNDFKGNRQVTFELNERVSIRDLRDPNPKGKKWVLATVSNVLGNRNFMCTLDDGTSVRRHIDQIHKCQSANTQFKHSHKTANNTDNTKNTDNPNLRKVNYENENHYYLPAAVENAKPKSSTIINNNNILPSTNATTTAQIQTKSTATSDTHTQSHAIDIENTDTHGEERGENRYKISQNDQKVKPPNSKIKDISHNNTKPCKYKNKPCEAKNVCDIEDLDECLKIMYKEPITTKRPKRNVKAPSRLNL